MAICFATRKSNLDTDLVLDSQFYDPQKLGYIDKLGKQSRYKISDKFSEIIDLTSSQKKLSFPFLVYNLTESLGNLFADGEVVNSAEDIGSTKKIAQPNDFAVSRLRYYLKEFGLVPKREYPPLLSTEYVVLRQKGTISPHLLIPFFLLSEIQFIFEHSQRGSEHPRLANKDILNLPLPDSLVKKAEEISGRVASAIESFEKAKKFYPEAEQELLERMEWHKVAINQQLGYVATSNDIRTDERLDPEFYQPKFENLEKHLKAIGSMTIDQVCGFVNHGIQPPYFDGGTVSVITQKEMTPTFLELESVKDYTDIDFYKENPDFQLKQRDVLLYSVGAYIGRCNILLDEIKAMAGSFVTILRTNENFVIPEYLALFLNSPAGIMQSRQQMRGTAQHYLYPRDIKKIRIFIPRDKSGKPDLAWQKKLADKVISANKAKTDAKKKLEEAKSLVEKEIEKLVN